MLFWWELTGLRYILFTGGLVCCVCYFRVGFCAQHYFIAIEINVFVCSKFVCFYILMDAYYYMFTTVFVLVYGLHSFVCTLCRVRIGYTLLRVNLTFGCLGFGHVTVLLSLITCVSVLVYWHYSCKRACDGFSAPNNCLTGETCRLQWKLDFVGEFAVLFVLEVRYLLTSTPVGGVIVWLPTLRFGCLYTYLLMHTGHTCFDAFVVLSNDVFTAVGGDMMF
eukprot:gene3022-2004_t